MRMFGRALGGAALTAITFGLLIVAAALFRPNDNDENGRGEFGSGPRLPAVVVETVSYETATPVISAFGTVEAAQMLELRAAASGPVIEIAPGLRTGGQVSVGERLLVIDPADAEAARDRAAADLADAEAQLRENTSALDLAQADLRTARTQFEIRQRSLERTREIARRGAATDATVEAAEIAASQAEQTVISRRQTVLSLESAIARAEIAVDRANLALTDAERTLADTVITAPFDAIVDAAGLSLGRRVTENEQIATLIDPSALEVSFRVSTAQYARLLSPNGGLRDQSAKVTLDLGDVPFTASAVLEREGAAMASGETGRRLYARLDPASGAVLRVGDFVSVEVEEPPLRRVASLPAAALSAGGEVLIVGEDNTLAATTVEVLRRQGDRVLARGLEPGVQYVAARVPTLGDGIRISPLVRDGHQLATAQPEAPATITLDPERRARLIAFVDANTRMPAPAKARMLTALEQPEVPREMVDRLESRMGG
ncbi:MAG: HlyD family efflux transporter periplasmic adaptor subunit [Pseudomonadota bacterium]